VLDNPGQGVRPFDSRRIVVVSSGEDSLLATPPVVSGRASARQILKAKGVRIMRLSFDTGQVMKERVEHVPMLIQTLQGKVTLSVSGKRIDMPTGAIVHLDKQLAHSITALESSQLMVTLLGSHASRPGAESDVVQRPTRGHAPTMGRIRLQERSRSTEWAQHNFVLAATGLDSEAFDEITRRHAELLGELAVKATLLLDVLASEGEPDDVLADLLVWVRSSLLPYLGLEAEILYPVVSLRPQQRTLVVVLEEELARVVEAANRLAEAEGKFDVATAVVALRVIVGRHLTAEADVLLPTLMVSSDDSFASLWARLNERAGTPVSVH
jgi:quercetin dioxygenase-like cupin family protein